MCDEFSVLCREKSGISALKPSVNRCSFFSFFCLTNFYPSLNIHLTCQFSSLNSVLSEVCCAFTEDFQVYRSIKNKNKKASHWIIWECYLKVLVEEALGWNDTVWSRDFPEELAAGSSEGGWIYSLKKAQTNNLILYCVGLWEL